MIADYYTQGHCEAACVFRVCCDHEVSPRTGCQQWGNKAISHQSGRSRHNEAENAYLVIYVCENIQTEREDEDKVKDRTIHK